MADPPIENNEHTVRRVYEDCLNGDRMHLLPALVAGDFVGPQGEGPTGFGRALMALRTGFPDLHYTIEDLFAEGDRVAVRWTSKGTHRGPFQGLAPTGKPVSGSGIAIFHLRDGKIIRGWTETNRVGFLQQIGVLPPEKRLQAGAGTSR